MGTFMHLVKLVMDWLPRKMGQADNSKEEIGGLSYQQPLNTTKYKVNNLGRGLKRHTF
jgi:hypothetical protein